MAIRFSQLAVQGHTTTLSIDEWTIDNNDSWGIFSAEGDIGSLLGDLLCGELKPTQGTLDLGELKVVQVSLSEQQRLLERELEKDDTDFLDRIDQGSTVYA
ncbi:ABC transporter, partial [Vibrio sp. 1978]|nr:ABC transporter [Vibrio sp. 1978]